MMQTQNTEIIELMSDEELPDRNVKRTKSKVCNSNCINFKCCSGIDMKLAPSFACAFYGVIDKKKKKRVICKQCFNAALQHQKVKIFNSYYKNLS
jgi:histone-lysine N-methyltransferase SETDB1